MTQDSVKKPKKPVIIKILKKEFSPRVHLRKSHHKVDYSILDIKQQKNKCFNIKVVRNVNNKICAAKMIFSQWKEFKTSDFNIEI